MANIYNIEEKEDPTVVLQIICEFSVTFRIDVSEKGIVSKLSEVLWEINKGPVS